MNDDDLDHAVMIRGKYKAMGLTPDQVADKDPSYLCWAYEKWDVKPCSRLLYEEALKDVARAATDRHHDRVARDQDRE